MRKSNKSNSISHRLGTMAASFLLTVMTVHSAAANASISNIPLRAASGADPNIMFVIDDSGSMHWEVTPDDYVIPYYIFPRTWSGIYGGDDYIDYVPTAAADSDNDDEAATARALRSSSVNRSYYDPSVTYEPWIKADGDRFPDAVPEAAFHHPVQIDEGTRDLTQEATESARWLRLTEQGGAFWSDEAGFGSNELTFFPARYFHYEGGEEWDASNYTEVRIDEDGAPFTGHGRADVFDDDGQAIEENRTDCEASDFCTYEEEIQNFANWYTYYRSRILAAQGAIGIAFSDLDEDPRVGFGALNQGSHNVDGVNTQTIVRGLRPFLEDDREAFYEELYEREYPAAGTPLRRALEDAGEYYSRADDRGPWSSTPGETGGGPHLECRQSYTILMTDGYWDPGNRGVDNIDGSDGSTISAPDGRTFTYNPSSPFQDVYSDTLADVAMKYWKNDLRPAGAPNGLANRVPVSDDSVNEAFWQHMVTFGVGLGVEGTIDSDEAFDAITDEEIDINWPNPTSSNAAKIDDLLHAGVNSRGGFFTANDPVAFGAELGGVLGTIIDRAENSATSAAASSAILNDDSDRFRARFRGSDWSGDVIAENIETGDQVWSAEEQLRVKTSDGDDPGARNLISYDGNEGVSLDDFFNLSGTQQDALDQSLDGDDDGLGESRLNWLRGGSVEAFRSREFGDDSTLRLLGDIVNSNPQIDRKTNFGFDRLPDGDYRGFRATPTYQNRVRAIYTGANDGYLHAFDSETGEELFAYMPGSLLEPEGGGNEFAPVNRLMDPDYAHRFYVDGTPTISDAFVDGEWKTVLVGSMGVGGDRVFALDVTDPESFTEDDVLWEFDDADLGRGVDRVQVGRLATGEWAAIFGNGYEDNGKLFVVDMEDGSLIETLDAGGTGLSTPVLTVSGGLVEYAYAGNISGEIWRYDLSSDNSNQWDADKLFQAEDPNEDAQPITARPRVAAHPNRPGVNIVLFGTGAFFREGDRGDSQTQSLYGIFDDTEAENLSRDDLQAQTVVSEEGRTVAVEQDDGTTEDTEFQVRELSDNVVPRDKEGWYLDLDTSVSGERVLAQATFPSGLTRTRVRFTSLEPDDDPCGPSVSGWVMELDVASGGQLEEPVFDLSRDGEFDACCGFRLDDPPSELTTIRDGDADVILDQTEGPDLKAGDLGVGRQSWEQLR